jgi:uncharacterized membrane protein
MLRRLVPVLLQLPLLATATSAAGEPPAVLVCRGHAPEWSLRIDGSAATLATLGTRGLTQTAFDGRLQEASWARPPFSVYRGRAEGSGADLVAVITREACLDTMADATEGGGSSDHTARVSLPGGEVRVGCCAAPRAAAASSAPVAPSSAPAAAAPGAGGELTALTLPDGTTCRSTGKGATLAFEGRRLNFDCGTSGVDKVGLLGPVAIGPEGMLTVQWAEIAWSEGFFSVRKAKPALARASEIALADGLTCHLAGTGATLAFGGRRASYTCGTKDGDTVALLGELEPAEGGFRIAQARIAHGESGFALRSSETILVTAPR